MNAEIMKGFVTIVLMAFSSVPYSAFTQALAMCAQGKQQIASRNINAAYNSIQAHKPEPRRWHDGERMMPAQAAVLLAQSHSIA